MRVTVFLVLNVHVKNIIIQAEYLILKRQMLIFDLIEFYFIHWERFIDQWSLMELFGCVLQWVHTIVFVKKHFKTNSSTARTKCRLQKDTYWGRRVQLILGPQMFVIFSMFIFSYLFELFTHDSP